MNPFNQIELHTPYSKMAAILEFFCLLANYPLLLRSIARENVILNFKFKSEATRGNLRGDKRTLNLSLTTLSFRQPFCHLAYDWSSSQSFKNSVKITKKQLSQNGLLWFSTLYPNLAPQTVKTALIMEENNAVKSTPKEAIPRSRKHIRVPRGRSRFGQH